MIAANEAIAAWAIREGVPALYRIHEAPDREKLENLRTLAAEFDLSLPKGDVRPVDLQRLLDSVRGQPQEPLLQMATLRSLAQARYAPANEGHFGLASSAYAHFTSPIRRYPDLVVHRQLTRWLTDPASARSLDSEWLDASARQASAQERRAAEAERDSIELKKIQPPSAASPRSVSSSSSTGIRWMGWFTSARSATTTTGWTNARTPSWAGAASRPSGSAIRSRFRWCGSTGRNGRSTSDSFGNPSGSHPLATVSTRPAPAPPHPKGSTSGADGSLLWRRRAGRAVCPRVGRRKRMEHNGRDR